MKVIQWLWSKMGKTGPFMLLYYVKVHNWRDPNVDVISWTQVQRRTGTKMMCLAAVHMINGGTRQLPSSLPKLCSATLFDAKKKTKQKSCLEYQFLNPVFSQHVSCCHRSCIHVFFGVMTIPVAMPLEPKVAEPQFFIILFYCTLEV